MRLDESVKLHSSLAVAVPSLRFHSASDGLSCVALKFPERYAQLSGLHSAFSPAQIHDAQHLKHFQEDNNPVMRYPMHKTNLPTLLFHYLEILVDTLHEIEALN